MSRLEMLLRDVSLEIFIGLQAATARQIKTNFYEVHTKLSSSLNGLSMNPDKLLLPSLRETMTHHPDMNPSGSANSGTGFKKISEAYSVLSDPVQRKQYDQTLTPSGMSMGGKRCRDTYAGMAGEYGTRNAERRANANYAWSTRGSRSSQFSRGDVILSNPPNNLTTSPSISTASNVSPAAENLIRLLLLPLSRAWLEPSPNNSSSRHPRPKVSPARQAAQMAIMLSLIIWVGSKLQF
ncbi:hypothetical protein H4Q26_009628 [Puccinia striiformis f. sp. tritici PST-130]|nr:hypothetical protein H4Q26_009628 [Puccinia striiformis f. sp. tritici PST-130]